MLWFDPHEACGNGKLQIANGKVAIRLGQIGSSGRFSVMTPQTFRHKIVVKGDRNILDYIAGNLNLNQPGQVVKRSDPSDVEVTEDQMRLMRGGMPIQFGTTRVEISFNSNVEEIKSYLREHFPNLRVE